MEMEMESLNTPALLLDVEIVQRNAERMRRRADALGVSLRPHAKTHKCVEVARLQTKGCSGGLTVSTLAEAEMLAAGGITDILYAVPVDPGKFDRSIDLSRRCSSLSLLTDSLEIATGLNDSARRAGVILPVFVKIDCGYHRCGVDPDSDEVLRIASFLQDSSHLRFHGILTHAGQSYACRNPSETLDVARHERDVMVGCADRLRMVGLQIPVVSIGSTPTMMQVDHLQGIDEIRPGNYIFFDEFQAARGNCKLEDCALSVLTAIIHIDRVRHRIVVDAGAIALSKDHGPIDVHPSAGFGRVVDIQGNDLHLNVSTLSQEHGEIDDVPDHLFDDLKIGSRLRVMANHSCLTAAQHSQYNVLEGDRIVDRWQIHRGW